MISKNLRSLALTAALIVIVSACETQPTATGASPDTVAEVRGAFFADLQQCTRTHGYDPNAAGLPENALAPNELPWRQCAYDAARNYGMTHQTVSGLYDQLIAEDIEMTTALQQGTMTRTQRRSRVEQLLEQIKAAEEAQKIKAASYGKDATETADEAQQRYQLRHVVEGVRGFSQ